MKFNEFVTTIKKELEAQYTQYQFKIKTVTKLNNVKLTGVVLIKSEEDVAPTVYLESFYEEYKESNDIKSVVKNIEEYLLVEVPYKKQSFSFLEDYDKVKNNIYVKLINYKENISLLKEVPHKKFLNLAIIFYYCLEQKSDIIGMITIKNEHLRMWNVTEHILHENALIQTKIKLGQEISSMVAVMEEFLDIEEKENVDVDEMYIFSNYDKNFGASAILDFQILEEFANKNEISFYLLPSSIHEWILLTATDTSKAYTLQKLVKEINESHVREEEILGSSIYYYDYHHKQLEILLE